MTATDTTTTTTSDYSIENIQNSHLLSVHLCSIFISIEKNIDLKTSPRTLSRDQAFLLDWEGFLSIDDKRESKNLN